MIKFKSIKYKKFYFLFIILIIIIVLLIIMFSFRKSKDLVCINGKCVEVLIADNQVSREKGLMFEKELCSSCGMLFNFESSGKYGFWMKNTLIPLDIIWIDSDYRIIDYVNADTCIDTECISYYPEKIYKYALEVNQGYFIKNNLSIGDKVEIKIRK